VGVGLASNFLVLWYLLSMEMSYGGSHPREWAKQVVISFVMDVLIFQPLTLAAFLFAFQWARSRLRKRTNELLNLSPPQYEAAIHQHSLEKQMNSVQDIFAATLMRSKANLNSAAAHKILENPKKSKSKKSMRKAKNCDAEIELADLRARKPTLSKSRTSKKILSEKPGFQIPYKPVYASKSQKLSESKKSMRKSKDCDKEIDRADLTEVIIDRARKPTRSAAAHIPVTSENVGNDTEISKEAKSEQPVTKKSKSKKSMRKSKDCDKEIERADLTEVIIDRARRPTRSKSQTSKKKLSEKLGLQNRNKFVG